MRNNIIFSVVAFLACCLAGYFAVKLIDSNRENARLHDVIAAAPQRGEEVAVDTIYETIINEKDTTIVRYQIYDRVQHGSVVESSISVSYADSLKRALKIGNDAKKALTKVTRMNTDLSKKLQAKDLKHEQLQNQIWHWKNENSEVIARLSDSIAEVKYNAKITVTEYSKKPNWFAQREYYTAISTDDEDLKINGVQMFEQKAEVKCSRFNLGGYAGYGAQLNDGLIKVGPQIGFGLTYDLF